MNTPLPTADEILSLLAAWQAARCESCPSLADFLADQEAA